MTCVLSSPWQPPFSSTSGWAPMNPGDNTPTSSVLDRSQYGYVSSGSESRHASGSGKKRASRAGTRSVSQLSAAQLERKRANDREAQRAIRQRTKDHIDSLERNISELRASNDANERIAAAAHQRSRELEDENAYLRTKLGEVGYPMAVPPENNRPSDHTLVPPLVPSPSAQSAIASIPRPSPTSTPHSTLSINTSQASSSRHGSWQQGSAQFPPSSVRTPGSLPPHSSVQMGQGLTSWRSHDSAPNVHSSTEQHLPPQPSYQPGNPNDRQQWSVPTPYAYHEQQRTPTVSHDSPQPQQPYTHPSVTSYAAATPQQQPAPTYVSPPENEFQNMSVQSPAGYQVQQQPGYGQPPSYQMNPMQMAQSASAPDYSNQQSQIHPPQMPPTAYPTSQPEQHYSQPQIHPPVQYREDPNNRGYSMAHFSTG